MAKPSNRYWGVRLFTVMKGRAHHRNNTPQTPREYIIIEMADNTPNPPLHSLQAGKARPSLIINWGVRHTLTSFAMTPQTPREYIIIEMADNTPNPPLHSLQAGKARPSLIINWGVRHTRFIRSGEQSPTFAHN